MALAIMDFLMLSFYLGSTPWQGCLVYRTAQLKAQWKGQFSMGVYISVNKNFTGLLLSLNLKPPQASVYKKDLYSLHALFCLLMHQKKKIPPLHGLEK